SGAFGSFGAGPGGAFVHPGRSRRLETWRHERAMRGAIIHGPRDVRLELREEPAIVEPTDAIIRLAATCVCGSRLWDYRRVPSVRPAWDVDGPGGWGREAAEAGRGAAVAVDGGGAVELVAMLAAAHRGGERIGAMRGHEPRRELAVEFGATDIVEERGDEGV